MLIGRMEAVHVPRAGKQGPAWPVSFDLDKRSTGMYSSSTQGAQD